MYYFILSSKLKYLVPFNWLNRYLNSLNLVNKVENLFYTYFLLIYVPVNITLIDISTQLFCIFQVLIVNKYLKCYLNWYDAHKIKKNCLSWICFELISSQKSFDILYLKIIFVCGTYSFSIKYLSLLSSFICFCFECFVLIHMYK